MKEFFKKHKKFIKTYLNMTLGVMLVAFGFAFFVEPIALDIGGASGLGVIIHEVFGMNTAVAILIINSILLVISLFLIGKKFFFNTIYGALTYPLFDYLFSKIYEFILNHFPEIDIKGLDLVIIVLFSSVIMGYGLGIVVKNGGSTGGTEIPQKLMHKFFHMSFSVSLYLIDGLIIIGGFFAMHQKLDVLLYEIIFVIVCGVVMDTTIFDGFNKRSVYIISDNCEEITKVLINEFARGVTGFKVIGEYSKTDKKMICCLLSSYEYNKLRDIIEKIDPKAFFFCMRASEVRGEGFTYESESNTVIKK